VISCDIFCRVVDNFGDIGVTWRLSRQLACEHNIKVRLIVDDLGSFRMIEPAINPACGRQELYGVTVMKWDDAAGICPPDFVIEAFGATLPETYVAAMAANATPPVWINLEYLSAEAWIETHHLLPSPHPTLPLTKHFFFPGFTPQTGGLMREQNLLVERDAAPSYFATDSLCVFLFAYDNAARDELITAMCASGKTVRCTVPDSAFVVAQAGKGDMQVEVMPRCVVETVPFASQRSLDKLLWEHDVLFVRGEDSFVRAQWAAKPFIWQIYPQAENAHWVKLNAFLARYCVGLADESAGVLRELWRAWNAEDCASIGSAWRQFVLHLPAFQSHAQLWSKKLAQMPDLAANLLSFYRKTTKI
jgi:uncharacterized repeat protein (TIGR03837 family)